MANLTGPYLFRTPGGAQSAGGSQDSSYELTNLAIATSVGSNALTVALKGNDGNDPSVSNVVKIAFRDATAATGEYNQRSITAALSIVVSSGSTLGHTNGSASYIYVYAIDNGGTVELAVSSKQYDDGSILSTTAEGGAGGADSRTAIYSTTARSNVPIRLIARLKSTQATAGTWAANMSEISLVPFMPIVPFSNFNAPLRIECAVIGFTAGTPSVASQTGTWITSLTDNGNGNVTLNIPAGFFSSNPFVVGSCINAGNNTSQVLTVSGTSTTSITILNREDGVLTDINYHLIVVGAA